MNFTFVVTAADVAKSLQSCPPLCDPINGSPQGSPAPGILQARTLEWVAISFSSAWKWKWRWSHWVVSDYSHPHGLQPTRFLRPWDFPGKSTRVGCHCLLLRCYYFYFFFCFTKQVTWVYIIHTKDLPTQLILFHCYHSTMTFRLFFLIIISC